MLTEKQIKKAERILSNMDTESLAICDFGSCQYNSLEQAYTAALKLHKFIKDWPTIFSLFGYELKGNITPAQEADAVKAFIAEQLKSIEEFLKEDPEDEYALDAKESLKDVITLDDAFSYAKGEAWDLWSAIPAIFQGAFPSVESITEQENAIKDESQGPLLNMMAWEENIMLGIQAAMLQIHFPTLNSESFSHFDT